MLFQSAEKGSRMKKYFVKTDSFRRTHLLIQSAIKKYRFKKHVRKHQRSNVLIIAPLMYSIINSPNIQYFVLTFPYSCLSDPAVKGNIHLGFLY
ncbi:hypothetical protein SAMN04488511_10443 [Pedobacter suwonensis]|uniref:Uncharacterized protein n=1 Tax=Pedobacter suwonensis TaxID=332999 RepID=A0A1I0SXA2_9SPHI|nr:hypothetical protein SAMN04488511_10443 [Pedobacter suwonensis]